MLPVFILFIALVIKDYKILFYLFFFLLPFSIEIYLPNGLGTDLPSEPLMLGICFVVVLLLLYRFPKVDSRYIMHPVSLLILAHLIWIAFTSLTSQNQVVSFKFFLAKLWYVIPFYFAPFMILRKGNDIKRLSWLTLSTLLIAVAYVFIKHSSYDFSFKYVHKAMSPIFRNHVSYASLLVIFLPYVWMLFDTTKRKSIKIFTAGSILFLLIAIYFSFTRAAMGGAVIAIGAYYIFKYRLAKIAVFSGMTLILIGAGTLMLNNRYLDFAPDFEKTITHTKFDNLIEATYKMEDISSMERIYRWVAGMEMIKTKPILGYGPSTFYWFYKEHTLSSFQTYVSDNRDHSGIHNYFLMTFVEQGVIGFLIFIGLCLYLILLGERVYHRLKKRKSKSIVMAALLSLLIIIALISINDLLEVDKVGPYFFLAASIIVIYDIHSKKELTL